ncbi:21190_t:CDS:2, partial [Dentiscutata erythropus]
LVPGSLPIMKGRTATYVIPEFCKHITLFDIPMREAITTPSANMEMNYERLETLGDSFLKFPYKHEGQLHCQPNIDDVNIIKQKKVHELANKTLADVVEAMLGAAYMSGQVDAALKCAIALDIQMEDIDKWG